MVATSRVVSGRRPGVRPASSVRRDDSGCEIGDLFAMLGRPHMLRLLHLFVEAKEASIRFTDLQNRLRLSPKTLSQRLRTLVEAGFLARHTFNEIPPRVEYQATPKTAQLAELFGVLASWARRNTLTAVPRISVVGRVST